jgi:hypothetical protein
MIFIAIGTVAGILFLLILEFSHYDSPDRD